MHTSCARAREHFSQLSRNTSYTSATNVWQAPHFTLLRRYLFTTRRRIVPKRFTLSKFDSESSTDTCANSIQKYYNSSNKNKYFRFSFSQNFTRFLNVVKSYRLASRKNFTYLYENCRLLFFHFHEKITSY